MKNKKLIIIFFLLFSQIYAQNLSESVDSLETAPAQTDTTKTSKKTLPTQWQKMRKWNNPQGIDLPGEELNHIIYDDTGELLSRLPYLQMWRDGDVGLFSAVSINSSPPRFTKLRIDDMLIPTGIYGQMDLAFIPETTLEDIHINPFAASTSIHTRRYRDGRPVTLFDYVMGPYSGDALRVRFHRWITPKWRLNWGATFANSEGHWFTPYYGPFDANRVHGIINYRYRPNLEIRYRFLQSDNEAVQSYPLFLDEYPQILQAKRDQRRFLNSLEIVRLVQNADSTQQVKYFDKWQLRLYNWKLQEQYSGGFGSGRYTKPQSKYTGLSGFYLQNILGVGLKHNFRLENRTLDNDKFPLAGTWQEFDGSLEFKHAIGHKIIGKHIVAAAYHSKFNAQLHLEHALKYNLSKSSSLHVEASSIPYFPQPGEYAHEIDLVLAGNSALEPMRYSQVGLRFDHAQEKTHFYLAAGQAFINNAIELSQKDSLLHFENRKDTYAFPTLSISAALPIFLNLRLKLMGNARLATFEKSSLFAEMPSMNGSAEVSYARSFFDGELAMQALLRGRYWHDRYHFHNYQQGDFFEIWQGGKGSVLDVELRAFFRDAMIFIKYENITGLENYWRPFVLMRAQTMKWGISWAMWD